MPTFVLNDENKKNSYGFRVRNNGANFERFDNNPVMLDSHENKTKAVLGSWKNRRVEGANLMADTVFDSEDPNVEVIEGKVNRGFVKGCSMGILFEIENMERAPDGVWDLTQWELLEASICAVPSNAGSLQLFDREGRLIPEDEVKLSMQKLTSDTLSTINKQTQTSTMEIKLTPAAMVALDLQSAEDVVAVSKAIENLAAENTRLKKENTDLGNKVEEQAKLQANALVDPLVTSGALTAEEGKEFKDLAVKNYELAAKFINMRAPKTTLSSTVVNQNAATTDGPKTMADFQKLTVQQQLAFKAENPDGYKALFKK